MGRLEGPAKIYNNSSMRYNSLIRTVKPVRKGEQEGDLSGINY